MAKQISTLRAEGVAQSEKKKMRFTRSCVVCDALKRTFLNCLKQHGAFFSYENAPIKAGKE